MEGGEAGRESGRMVVRIPGKGDGAEREWRRRAKAMETREERRHGEIRQETEQECVEDGTSLLIAHSSCNPCTNHSLHIINERLFRMWFLTGVDNWPIRSLEFYYS